MTIPNSERAGKALDLFNAALRRYVRRDMESVHNDRWLELAHEGFRDERTAAARNSARMEMV